MRNSPRHNSAYVLLMTLLLLVMAAVAMLGVSRLSLQRAVASLREEEELQRKWASLSCRRTLLPRAETILAAAEARSREPVIQVTSTLTLVGQEVRLVFTDEQAKLNLNHIATDESTQCVQSAVGRLAHGPGLEMRFRPLASSAQLDVPSLSSWGQVFQNPSGGQLMGSPDGYPSPVGAITCWGDGRLNFQRTSGEALEERIRDSVGIAFVSQITGLRRETPGIGIDRVIDELELSSVQRSNLREALTSRSSCHGLWIATTSVRTGATKYELLVEDRSAQPVPRTYYFNW